MTKPQVTSLAGSQHHESNQVNRHELFEHVIDGDATEADIRVLSELVCSDETARREYAELIVVESLISQFFNTDLLPPRGRIESDQKANTSTDDGEKNPSGSAGRHSLLPELTAMQSPGGRRHLSRRNIALFAAALTVIVAVGVVAGLPVDWWTLGRQRQETVAEADRHDQSTQRGFGVLAEQADARWRSGTIPTGTILPRGQLALEAGTAHLELFSGVQLVVKGRAVFTVESPLRVVLHEGGARALVPDAAHGFQVETAAAAIVDLGTEFAVRVDGSTTDVTVLQGAIEVVKPHQEVVRVDSGRSFRLREDTSSLEELLGSVELPSSTSVGKIARNRRLKNFEIWQSQLWELESDERLVGRYCISGSDRDRIVPNHADASPAGSAAAVVGAEHTDNRWGQQASALDFTRSGSRLRLALPGQMAGLTMICWAKINSLNNDYNALLLTDGHDVAEPHWQILRDGRIFFSVKHPQPEADSTEQKVFYSPSFWREEMSGRWVMLAVTYDREQGVVHHFVNGKIIGREVIPKRALAPHVRIGDASIANWADPVYRSDKKFTSRNLNGAIDEFLIFSEPLSEAEVALLYASGDPDR